MCLNVHKGELKQNTKYDSSANKYWYFEFDDQNNVASGVQLANKMRIMVGEASRNYSSCNNFFNSNY